MFLLSRRQFLGSSALVLGAGVCSHSTNAASSSPHLPRSAPLKTFHYAKVRLQPSRLLDQFSYQTQLFTQLDDDKLLKPFRSRAGLPAPGEDMGGWYDDSRDFHIDPTDWSSANWHGYIPGHSFGQYVSGLARSYAATFAPEVAAKVRGLVTKYLPTITPRFFENYYLPAYTYDKLAIGLIDAYRFVGVEEAKLALEKLTDAVLPFLPEKALTREERRERPYTTEAEIWDEPYTLPENLFIAWQAGMGERYKALAIRYLQNEALFDPLAKGISPLAGKHAYSHVNALNSAIQAYYSTGNKKYLAAAKNGFDFVVAQSYATGGWGPNEELLAPNDSETLLNSLQSTHRSFETPCGVYGHFKIARSLLQITRDSQYGDSMERILYNTVLGATPTQANGDTFYYADYNHNASKFIRGEKWPCCSGTFIQLAADYGISTYLQEAEKLFVNLYVPSSVIQTLEGQTITLHQNTAYPFEASSTFDVETLKPIALAVCLRIPAWAGKNTQVRINGKIQSVPIKPGSFHEIKRVWNNADRIEISFDMALRTDAINAAHAEWVALLFGPLVLFPVGRESPNYTNAQLLAAKRKNDQEWVVSTAEGDRLFKPFMIINKEQYRLYNKIKVIA